MTDYQEIVENIRSFLAASDQSQTEELADWANEYARLCKEANDRLRRCVDCLQRDLRDEAIQLANSPPNLLDFVAALDIPELEDWKQTCLKYGLREPPRLLVDIAAAMNEAYSESQPLEGLMAHHRLMALARAPLTARLTLLRRIAQKDKTAGIWEEDIVTFERARLDQIRQQLPRSLRAGDRASLDEMLSEVRSTSWRSKVAPDLLLALIDASRQAETSAFTAQLQQVASQINEAYGAMNEEECQTLLETWHSLVSQAAASPPPELTEQIEPAIQWLGQQREIREQQDAFSAACADLQEALDVNAIKARLDRAYLAIRQFPFEMPEDLEKQYRKRLAGIAAAARHKRNVTIAGIAAGILITIGIVFLIRYLVIRSNEASEVCGVLQQAKADADSGYTDKAELAVKEISQEHPRVLSDSQVSQALVEVHAAVHLDRLRQTDFQAHLKAAVSAGVEHPDEDDLQAAEQSAKTTDEQAATAQLRAAIAVDSAAKQGVRDDGFAGETRKLLADAGQTLTDALVISNIGGYQKALADFNARTRELGSRTGISDSLKQTQIAAIFALLKEKQDRMAQAQSEETMYQQIVRASANAADHGAAIKKFIDTFPNSPRTPEFQLAVQHVADEEAIQAWGSLSAGWTGEFIPAQYASAAARKTALDAYLKQYPTSAFAGSVAAYARYLGLGLTMTAPDGPWKKAYHDLLNNPLVHDLEFIDTPTGRYYGLNGKWSFKAPSLEGSVPSIMFHAVTTSDVAKLSEIKLQRNDHPDLPMDGRFIPSTSPQAHFAADALARLAGLDFAGWDVAGIQEVEALRNAVDIHPVLRGILLENLLQYDQPVRDWIADTSGKSIVATLTDLHVDDTEWLDPAHVPNEATVDGIGKAFSQLPFGDAIRRKIVEQRDIACAPLKIHIHSQAIVVKDAAGRQRIEGGMAVSQDIAMVATEGGALTAVGKFDGQKWDLNGVAAAGLPDGQLVFIGVIRQ